MGKRRGGRRWGLGFDEGLELAEVGLGLVLVVALIGLGAFLLWQQHPALGVSGALLMYGGLALHLVRGYRKRG